MGTKRILKSEQPLARIFFCPVCKTDWSESIVPSIYKKLLSAGGRIMLETGKLQVNCSACSPPPPFGDPMAAFLVRFNSIEDAKLYSDAVFASCLQPTDKQAFPQ